MSFDIDAESAYRELKYALRDGRRVSGCIYDLLFPFCTMTDMYNNWGSLTTDQQSLVRQMWRVVLTWTTHVKSTGDIQAFLAHKCTCFGAWRATRSLVQNARHRMAEKLVASSEIYKILGPLMGDKCLAWYVLDQFTKVYGQAIDRCAGLQPHLISHPHRLHHGKLGPRESWPRSLEDLIPHGLHDTLRGLLQWFKHDPPTIICGRLVIKYVTLLHFASPIIQPHLVTSRDFFLYAVIKPLERIWINAGRDCASDWNAQARACFQALNLVIGLSGLLNAFDLGDGSRVALRTLCSHAPQVFFDCMCLAIHSCHSITSACRLAQHPQLTEDLVHEVNVRAGIFQWWATGALMRYGNIIKLSGDPLHLEMWMDATQRKQEVEYHLSSDYVRLMFFLVNFDSQICMAPSCSQSAADGCLRRCTGCHRVQYCSKMCQKRAWTYANAPHRLVCSKIAALARQYEIPEVWPLEYDELEKLFPDSDSRFRSRAKSVLRNFECLARARLTLLVTGAVMDNSAFLRHDDYNRLGPPVWMHVDPRHYPVQRWSE